MGRETGKTSKIAATVLVVVNLIVMTFCAVLFALSLWMISSPSTMSSAIRHFGTPAMRTLLTPETLSVQLGIGAAALATFFFFVAFMGLYGAFSRSQFLLFMYSTLVLLLLLLECALMYYFSSSLVEKGLQEQDGQWTHALRLAFRCCEHNTTLHEVPKLPWSCCGTLGHPDNCTATHTFTKVLYRKAKPLTNCHQTIPAWLNRYQTAIYASLAVLHIVLSSCSLLRRARSAAISHS